MRGDIDKSGKTFIKALLPYGYEIDTGASQNGAQWGEIMSRACFACNLEFKRVTEGTNERYVHRPPLKLPFMAIRLFAAHFWIPSRRTQRLVAGDPKFQRRRRILILAGFPSRIFQLSLMGTQTMVALPSKLDEIPLLSRDGVLNVAE